MATGKNEKEYSWHVPAIKFIRRKQLVSKVANILEKLRNLWKWEIWGNIVKIWYFVNNFLIEASNSNILLHMCDTYNCDYLKHSTLRFQLNRFSVLRWFSSNFIIFNSKLFFLACHNFYRGKKSHFCMPFHSKDRYSQVKFAYKKRTLWLISIPEMYAFSIHHSYD